MTKPVRGMIAVDKIGCKILFLNPQTYETETRLEGFQRTVHELLVMPEAASPMSRSSATAFTAAINPATLHVSTSSSARSKTARPVALRAPHTVRLAADGMSSPARTAPVVAVIDPKTNKMVYAIHSGSKNGHRLAIAPDGQRLYTDNEEDAPYR